VTVYFCEQANQCYRNPGYKAGTFLEEFAKIGKIEKLRHIY